jgi:hypothetical protein
MYLWRNSDEGVLLLGEICFLGHQTTIDEQPFLLAFLSICIKMILKILALFFNPEYFTELGM